MLDVFSSVVYRLCVFTRKGVYEHEPYKCMIRTRTYGTATIHNI